MNIFEKINKADHESFHHHSKMIQLSNSISNILDIGDEEIKKIQDHDMVINIPGYSISSRSFPWHTTENGHGWIPILVVTPIQANPSRVGYSNTSEEKYFPPSWHIESNGTSSVFYPPDEEIEKIMFILNNHKNNL